MWYCQSFLLGAMLHVCCNVAVVSGKTVWHGCIWRESDTFDVFVSYQRRWWSVTVFFCSGVCASCSHSDLIPGSNCVNCCLVNTALCWTVCIHRVYLPCWCVMSDFICVWFSSDASSRMFTDRCTDCLLPAWTIFVISKILINKKSKCKCC